MANLLLPVVKLFFPCEDVTFDPDQQGFVLHLPVHAIAPPTGAIFPYECQSFACYAMVADAIGTFTFKVAVMYEGAERVLARSAGVRLTFSNKVRIAVQEFAFVLSGLRFPKPGLYPLVLLCNETPLPGGEFHLRVLGGTES